MNSQSNWMNYHIANYMSSEEIAEKVINKFGKVEDLDKEKVSYVLENNNISGRVTFEKCDEDKRISLYGMTLIELIDEFIFC